MIYDVNDVYMYHMIQCTIDGSMVYSNYNYDLFKIYNNNNNKYVNKCKKICGYNIYVAIYTLYMYDV